MRRESVLTDDFIYPVFVLEGRAVVEPVASCRHRAAIAGSPAEDGGACGLGIPALALFPVIDTSAEIIDAERRITRPVWCRAWSRR